MLSGHFSNDFWERRVLQACGVEPSIRHAVIAIGAVHQDFISLHKGNDKVYDPSIKAFAFRQYTKAISHLYRLMSTQTQQLDFTLISCILFICFDCISGNYDSAFIHLKAGLKILEDIKKQNAQSTSPEQTTSAHEWEREFAPILLGLGIQGASIVNFEYRKDGAAMWTLLKGIRIPTHPTTFRSIDEARHALETTIADIMVDRTINDDGVSACQAPAPKEMECTQHVVAMDNWLQALNRFLGTNALSDVGSDKINLAAHTLKLHWLVIAIVISFPNQSDDKFEQIIALCDSLVPQYGSNQRDASTMHFSTDIGIISPLFFTALRAPKVYLRRQAFELLSRAPRREGMWDSSDAIVVAGEASRELEEREESGNFTIPNNNPEHERLMSNDILTRARDRFTWPPAEEQNDTTAFSTSFPDGHSSKRSDPMEPRLSRTTETDSWHT